MGERQMDLPMDLRPYVFERRTAAQHHFHRDGLGGRYRPADLAGDPDGRLSEPTHFLMDVLRQHLG